jgi:GNAT superfamily N-acetyltransferase
MDKDIVGTGALIPKAALTAEIVRMSVATPVRRQGVATKILQALCDEAIRLCFNHIILETTSTWHAVIAFYKNFGFSRPEVKEGEFGEKSRFSLDLTDLRTV